MTIWQIAEYSLAISIVALLILLMKGVFHDKLDARWHYFIWLVLAVRILVPIGMKWMKAPISLFQAIPVGYWVDLWELMAQKAGIESVLKIVVNIYVSGVFALTAYYLLISIVLRVKIFRLPAADEQTVERVAVIAEKYNLKTCNKIKLTPTGTPFVCGLISPTLVLPAGEECWEEVILHELLHKKYGDVMVNYLLHVVRIFNWFNPLIWYVTGVVQNDSEALCDQRVLEAVNSAEADCGDNSWEKSNQEESCKKSRQKEYGTMLLNMAENKHFGKNTIGTSNMANSYRSMKIRIKRIVDFGKVPAGIGFAALCITIILSISSIANYDARKSIIVKDIENETDLNHAMLRAQVFEADTAEEAAYLYLKAMKDMNPMYLMAVLPKEEIPALEEWIRNTYRAEGFYHDEKGKLMQENWIYYKEILPNPWFIQDGNRMVTCFFYNMVADENRGSAVAEVVFKYDGEETSFWWDLEFIKEDGWKVRRLDEKEITDPKEMAPALLSVSEEKNGWMVEVEARNEGSFMAVFVQSGWNFVPSTVTGGITESQVVDYPSQFEDSIKWRYAYLSYQGEKSLEDSMINVLIRMYDEEELKQNPELANTELHEGKQLTKEELDILSGNTVIVGKKQEEMVAELKNRYSSSDGYSYHTFDGAELANGKRKLIDGSGGGYDSWNGDEKLHFTAWIYCDGECVEVIQK
ncbi:MAG: M56 family metallopeptidase [Lachnospiraceae bacterium]|nr:M56 family metallopeptidase [Lachnospiraceae bacterium]